MRTGMQIVTAREIAAFLRLKESTVCSLASHGKLPGFKFGKSWRFDLEKIERLIAGNENTGGHPASDQKNAEEA
jgi:excisionase family DNA binding protein